MAREFAMIVKESSYGVPMSSPVIGTDAFYLRLSDDNSLTMQLKPIVGNISYGGGLTTPACSYADQYTCTGQISGVMYAGAFAAFMANWALTPINEARTSPWVTTDAAEVMPPTDLASVSIYRGIQRSDGTLDRRRYSGMKVGSGSIGCSRQDPLCKYSFQIQGIRDDYNAAGAKAYPDATEFPPPDETDMSCGPYLFSHTGGKLTIGSVRTQYESVSLSWQNSMSAKWFESQYVQLVKFCGRDTKLATSLYMKATPDDLAALQAITKQTTSLGFDNGTNSLTIALNGNNVFSQLDQDLPNNGTYSWKGVVQNYYDPAVSGDVVVSST